MATMPSQTNLDINDLGTVFWQFPEVDSHSVGKPAPGTASDLPGPHGVRHPQVYDHRDAGRILLRMR